MDNEKLIQKLQEARSEAEIADILAAAGLEMPKLGELTEDALDDVAGGSIYWIVRQLLGRNSSRGSSGGGHSSGGGRHG